MTLTALQRDIPAVLSGNRSEESHFAGGIVLNTAPDSVRDSHDFDIFHEMAEEVAQASNADVANLRRAGFQVGTRSQSGEWDKPATFHKAKVSQGGESVEIDWAADSAFRFFPHRARSRAGRAAAQRLPAAVLEQRAICTHFLFAPLFPSISPASMT